jgi:hypothetical protein
LFESILWDSPDHDDTNMVYRIPDQLYTCPKCNENSLTFEFMGCWD